MILATLHIDPTKVMLEVCGGRVSIGKHSSNMILWKDGHDYWIGWEIWNVAIEIGLAFEGDILDEYDGVIPLPKEAIKLIRAAGLIVPEEFES